MNYVKTYQRYINFISNALQDKNLDSEDESWKLTAPLQPIICGNDDICVISSKAFKLNLPELLIMIRVKNTLPIHEDVSERIARAIKKLSKDDGDDYRKYDAINIIWILDDVKMKIKIRHGLIAIINRIRSQLSLPKRIKILSTFYIDRDINDNREIKLCNTKRPQMLMLPPIDTDINIQTGGNDDIIKRSYPSDLKGYVLTVHLFDVVDIYNQVGDDLFRDNVRFGLAEQMGVDKAIKDTLRNDPQYFWFRNNGITMLVEEPDMVLDRANEIVLKRSTDEKIRFSVINGAQTITAATEYFFGLQARIDEMTQKQLVQLQKAQQQLEDAKKAKVILRIIQIRGENIPLEAKRISVALNRQKPIKTEDIAFTNYFVGKMNEYLELHSIEFTIAKRNEISYSQSEYSLIEFARARKACAGKPGEARNKDASTLLKCSDPSKYDQIQQFLDEDVFVKDWYTSEDKLMDEKIFNKYYKPVLFAMKLAKSYELYHKDLLDNAESLPSVIIKNGKWYFVAFVIFILNGNQLDYSSFNCDIKNIKKEDIKHLIQDFSVFCSAVFQRMEASVDSNTFKNSKVYSDLTQAHYMGSNFYILLKSLYPSAPGIMVQKKGVVQSSQTGAITKVTSVKLSFNGVVKQVKHASDAFTYTVIACLKYARENNRDITRYISTCSYISLTEKTKGYFRSKDMVVIDKVTYYIGKNHDFKTKMNNIDNLCRQIGLIPGSVRWMKDETLIYKNS